MSSSSLKVIRQAQGLVLSVPVQAFLLISLGSLSLWTLYFSSYPAAHNQMHQTRHHTLGVGCH